MTDTVLPEPRRSARPWRPVRSAWIGAAGRVGEKVPSWVPRRTDLGALRGLEVPSLPPTAMGWVVIGVGAVSYLGAWQLGWAELAVLAAACILVLVIATPFVVGKLRLDVQRSVRPLRVMVGEPAVDVLAIRNEGRAAAPARLVEERVGDRAVVIEVPRLAPGAGTEAVHHLPTTRRGVLTVGPAVIVKADPLGLLRREVAQTATDRLHVHPRHRLLRPLPVGFAKDLEGPTTDSSPAGDVAFHALREYQVGDDYRRIHWMSTARTGTVMIRHHVDNRRPQVGVLLDDRAGSWLEDEFEVAVEIAASLTITGLAHQQPTAVHTQTHVITGQGRPGTRDSLLDQLCEVQVGDHDGSLTPSASRLLHSELGTSALVVITGGRDVHELVEIVHTARRRCRVILVRVWPPDLVEPGALPGATLFDVRSLEEFAGAWDRLSA